MCYIIMQHFTLYCWLDKQINHGNEEKAIKILPSVYKLVEQICLFFIKLRQALL